MSYLKSVRHGDDVYDYNITDLLSVETENGLMLYSVSGGTEGGIVSYSIGTDGSLLPGVATERAIEGLSGAGPSLLYISDENGDRIWHAGSTDGAIWSYDIGVNGALSSEQAIPTPSTGPLVAQLGPLAVVASPRDANITFYDWDGTSLTNGFTLNDSKTTYLQNPSSLASVTVGESDFVIVGSATERGVTVIEVNDGTPTVTSAFGADLGLGMMQPTVSSAIEYNDRTFVIVGSMPQNGQSGALTTFELSESGDLSMIDHRLDTRDTRFGQVQALDSIEVNGRAYVVAGGGDDGLSLFALTPDGKLLHLETIEDQVEIGLSGVTVTELVVTQNGLHLYVASEGDAGLGSFFIEGATNGHTFIGDEQDLDLTGGADADWFFGGAGSEVINAAAGDDLISDGAGNDQLTGGAGRDVFYLSEDNARDEIMDFDPTLDQIDLTEWRYVNDPSELSMTQEGERIIITYRDEILVVNPRGGVSLSIETVRESIIVDGARLWEQPSEWCPWDRSDWDGVLLNTMTLDADQPPPDKLIDSPPFFASGEMIESQIHQFLERSVLQDEFDWKQPAEHHLPNTLDAQTFPENDIHRSLLREQSQTSVIAHDHELAQFTALFDDDFQDPQPASFFSHWDMNF